MKSYSLNELEQTARGDVDFYNTMLLKFLSNVEQSVELMKDGKQSQHWTLVGETSHKMISSCRYFQMDELVHKLIKLEDYTLRDHKYNEAADIVEEIIDIVEQQVEFLRNELKY